MLTPGLYTMRSSSTNAPSGTYHSLIVNRSDTGNYIQQIAVKESSYEIYLRYNNGSSWSAWKQISMADHTHTAATTAVAGFMSTSDKSKLDDYSVASGTWTPAFSSRGGTNPTYSVYYRYGSYCRINNLVYVSFHMKANITGQGTDYACITGLPFTAASGMNGQALALHECFGGTSMYPSAGNIGDSTSIIYLQNAGGEGAQQWRTGDTWVGFSGCYLKA